MDALICQTYYNPALSIVLKQLIIGDYKKGSSSKKRTKNFDEDFSNVQSSNLYHIDIPKEFIDRKYIKLFDSLTTRRQIIPLGLYRTVKKIDLNAYKENYRFVKTNKKGNPDGSNFDPNMQDDKDFSTFKYVVTNPEENIKLRADDKVFVLAKNDPGNPENWDNYTYANKDMFDKK